MKPTSDSADIDPQIQALVIAARRFAKAQVPMMGLIADLGLRPPEIILLYSLGRARHEAPEGASAGVNPSDLAMRMGVTPGHVTQVLTSLERAGMVAREADPADRRRVW
jgi:DNA-binding MarR family transcriptional regulator